MKLNKLIDLNYNTNQIFNENSIFSKGMDLRETKILTLENSKIHDELSLIEKDVLAPSLDEDVEIVILSEPKFDDMHEEDLILYTNNYITLLSQAQAKRIDVVHFVSNIKWYSLFQDSIINDLFYLKDFHFYSNNINHNIIIDLTLYDGITSFYNKNINSILEILPKFKQVTILLEEGSYFPSVDIDHVNIIKTNELSSQI